MTSVNTKVDAVKAAISSASTCTPATTVTLRDLLLPESNATATTTTKQTTRRAQAKSTTRTTTQSTKTNKGASLSPKEQGELATVVINAALKSLTDAARRPAQSSPTKRTDAAATPRGPGRTTTLRRSLSTPLSPLAPRTLNRTATTIEPTPSKPARCPTPPVSTTHLSVVECARIAFQCLRSLTSPDASSKKSLQLELGMSAFIGKLLALGVHDQALKELRILKRRLEEGASGNRETKVTATASSASARVLSDLLDFNDIPLTAMTRPLAITTQLHVLRLLMLSKRPEHIDSAVPFLRDSNLCSPLNLLLQDLEQGKPKDPSKIVRQIESLAGIMLSLAPSISSSHDAEAMEPRLHPLPSSVFELQTLAMKAKLHSWAASKHAGDVDKEILAPLSRFLATFGRRQSLPSPPAHELCQTAFVEVDSLIQGLGLTPSKTSRSPLAAIFQSLGSSALSVKRYDEARDWIQQLYDLLDPEKDSTARQCSITAQLLAACLKCKLDEPKAAKLLKEAVAGIQGTFRGESTELDQLLVDLSLARKSAVGLLMKASERKTAAARPSPALTALLETFITQYPRFTLRWLGKPVGRDASAKDLLRFENRRQAVRSTLSQMMDAALVVVKSLISSGKAEWSALDSVLQDCLELLDRMGDLHLPVSGNGGNTYHVKISNLYYMQCALLRQPSQDPSDLTPLRALRRSIDAVRDRTPKEKEAAQFVTKLERFADICTKFRRKDEAREALQSICTTMVEEGVLSSVASRLNDQSPGFAWALSDKSELLSRTLCSMAKLDTSWNDWTFFLQENERAAILEHLVLIVMSGDYTKHRESLKLTDLPVDILLKIYSPDKFPVRRLRTLLHLFSINITNPEEASSLRTQIEGAIQAASGDDPGEDDGLTRYLPHLTAYFTSMACLLDWTSNTPKLQSSVSFWRNAIDKCRTREDIYDCIDNPAALSTHLRSMADLASMKGESSLLVTFLELLTELSKKTEESVLDDVVSNNSLLALQYTSLGYTDKAETLIASTREIAEQRQKLSSEAIADFYLSDAEYCLATASFEKAELCLLEAKSAFLETSGGRRGKSRASSLAAHAGLLYSMIALERGETQPALLYVRDSVKVMFQEWVNLEGKDRRSLASQQPDSSALGGSIETADSSSEAVTARVVQGANFWAIAHPLIRGLLRLSAVYAHLGMFQDTSHYAEQAHKIALSSGSPLYTAQCAAWAGSVFVKGGKPEKGLDFMASARSFVTQSPGSSHSVAIACQLGELYQIMGDTKSEKEMLHLAELAVRQASDTAIIPESTAVSDISGGLAKLTLAEVEPRTTRATRATRRAPVAKKPVVKKTAATKSRAVVKPRSDPVPEDARVSVMKALVLLYKALGHTHQKDWAAALESLEEAKAGFTGLGDTSRKQIIRATCLLGQSMDDMIRDPVFSVVQDSTISFPAVSLVKRSDHGPGASPAMSPPRKGRKGSAFVDSLKQAQEYLLEANSLALIKGDGGLLHRISSLLQSTVIFLSATSAKSGVMGHPAYATCAVELARNITWRRERKALQARLSTGQTEWPAPLAVVDPRRSSLGVATDITRFQRDFIDVIPSSWTVISISPSDNKQDLCITRLQAGHSPFVLRLPLERANSRDADTDVFNFQHGLDELRELIKLANKSSHSARDMSAKGARMAWWQERDDLDERFKELLQNIEDIWLGGFRGIFSQHQRRTDLLARFQKSFQTMLDKHLPSRRRIRGRRSATTPKITFDPRILELFIGLGDPSEEQGGDFDEVLTDLLYFVVDILQFHGEQNAYDEIDFDSMVVETLDALTGYHQAAKADGDADKGAHTILVLDKSLHAFPWESLPCMQGAAVSRVPSLACLRRLIIEQRPAEPVEMDFDSDAPPVAPEASRPGHHVSASSGTYILNPAADLVNTLATFEEPLSSMAGGSWSGIKNRAPTEAEFERALAESDVLLYFGHGSGAQYLRGRTVRRMEKCRAVALLMGCSSAGLEDCGEFECHGTVWNYMLAGSPAVVGALWDVTDREADRFAGRVFEEWGLVERGTFREVSKKGKGRTKRSSPSDIEEEEEEESSGRGCSLVEAVGRGRQACKYRYLTAAAMCVYGIPVYVKRDS